MYPLDDVIMDRFNWYIDGFLSQSSTEPAVCNSVRTNCRTISAVAGEFRRYKGHETSQCWWPVCYDSSVWSMFWLCQLMMTSLNGNTFRVTGLLWEEFTGYRWILLTKTSDAELWCFLISTTEQTVEETIETTSCSLWRHCSVPR